MIIKKILRKQTLREGKTIIHHKLSRKNNSFQQLKKKSLKKVSGSTPRESLMINFPFSFHPNIKGRDCEAARATCLRG